MDLCSVASVANVSLQDLGFFVLVSYTDWLKIAYRSSQHLRAVSWGTNLAMNLHVCFVLSPHLLVGVRLPDCRSSSLSFLYEDKSPM